MSSSPSEGEALVAESLEKACTTLENVLDYDEDGFGSGSGGDGDDCDGKDGHGSAPVRVAILRAAQTVETLGRSVDGALNEMKKTDGTRALTNNRDAIKWVVRYLYKVSSGVLTWSEVAMTLAWYAAWFPSEVCVGVLVPYDEDEGEDTSDLKQRVAVLLHTFEALLNNAFEGGAEKVRSHGEQFINGLKHNVKSFEVAQTIGLEMQEWIIEADKAKHSPKCVALKEQYKALTAAMGGKERTLRRDRC